MYIYFVSVENNNILQSIYCVPGKLLITKCMFFVFFLNIVLLTAYWGSIIISIWQF